MLGDGWCVVDGLMPRSQSSRQPPSKSNEQVKTIIEAVDGVPAEFGSDILMRIAESQQITDSVSKMRLLRKAFDLAASSQQSIKLRALPDSETDTRSGFLAIAFDLNLDRLSLQGRSIRDMLSLNRGTARSYFEQVRFPPLREIGCDESLVYDPKQFYQALNRLGHDGFNEKEVLAGQRISFLAPYVSSLQSHTQVAPIAHALSSMDLSRVELEELVNLFINSVRQLHGDERSFAAATLAHASDEDNVLQAFAELIKQLDAERILSAPALRALREYLTSNLGKQHCREQLKERSTESLPAVATAFNEQFQRELKRDQVLPITLDDLKDARILPGPKVDALWSSVTAKALLSSVQELRWGNKSAPLTIVQRTTIAWSAKSKDFMAQLESWGGEGESEADLFHEKSILYEMLVDLIPSGQDRSKALDSFVHFLEQNNFQQTSRIEWFWHAHQLLEGLRAADDRAEVLQAFQDSSDSVLSLYASFELLLVNNGPGAPKQ